MKYEIDYGFGRAVLYTPHEPVTRFNALAHTCFGIRKSIMYVEVVSAEDAECEYYERLEFYGDAYVWREDGARKQLAPGWAADDEWDEDYCEECRFVAEQDLNASS